MIFVRDHSTERPLVYRENVLIIGFRSGRLVYRSLGTRYSKGRKSVEVVFAGKAEYSLPMGLRNNTCREVLNYLDKKVAPSKVFFVLYNPCNG